MSKPWDDEGRCNDCGESREREDRASCSTWHMNHAEDDASWCPFKGDWHPHQLAAPPATPPAASPEQGDVAEALAWIRSNDCADGTYAARTLATVTRLAADLACEREARQIAEGRHQGAHEEAVRLRADLAEARRGRDTYHDALVARHGGEPVALLAEMDEARRERDEARDYWASVAERAVEERDRALLAEALESGRRVAAEADRDRLAGELAEARKERDELAAMRRAREATTERDEARLSDDVATAMLRDAKREIEAARLALPFRNPDYDLEWHVKALSRQLREAENLCESFRNVLATRTEERDAAVQRAEAAERELAEAHDIFAAIRKVMGYHPEEPVDLATFVAADVASLRKRAEAAERAAGEAYTRGWTGGRNAAADEADGNPTFDNEVQTIADAIRALSPPPADPERGA